MSKKLTPGQKLFSDTLTNLISALLAAYLLMVAAPVFSLHPSYGASLLVVLALGAIVGHVTQRR